MDEPPVHADLDAVLALGDVHVVDDVVYRRAQNGAARLRRRGRHVRATRSAEVDVIARTDSGLAGALASEPITDVIDDVGGDGPGVARSDTLIVGDQLRRWWLPGKLFHSRRLVLLQVAAHEDPVLR